jgi:hypothetical protein
VWLKFESDVKQRGKMESIITLNEMNLMADSCGIHDEKEKIESIRFLGNLGTLQYFENNFLKQRVIINPQVSFFKQIC